MVACQAPAFLQPVRQIALRRCRRMLTQDARRGTIQTAAAQPGRAGAIVPPAMQIALGQARVERVDDLVAVTAFVLGAGHMQRLVHVGHQMNDPRQDVAQFGAFAADRKALQQAGKLDIEFAIAALLSGMQRQVKIMPAQMAASVG